MLTTSQLQQVMRNLSDAKAEEFLPALNDAMQRYEINNELRAAAFVAQLAHESGEFKWMEEIWGPTAAQRGYEGRRDLGNTQPGDGQRFKGRGPIQITGRANYRKYGSLLGIDLESDPDQAATPDVGFLIAGLYWASNHLNELADAEQFVAITKRINGGTNGLTDRQMYYARAKEAFAGGTFGDSGWSWVSAAVPGGATRGISLEPADAPATAETAPASAPPERGAPSPSLDDLVPLSRGAEALREPVAAETLGAAPDAKTPAQRAAKKKPAAKKTAAKKTAAKPVLAKKAAGKKAAAKKVAIKAPAKKTPAKKAPAKKAPAKKAAAQKTAAGRTAAKKAPAKKTAAKKAPARGRGSRG